MGRDRDEHASAHRDAQRPARDLQQWHQTLLEAGHPACDSDFIIPGDLTGDGNGVRDPATDAVHLASGRRSSGAKAFQARGASRRRSHRVRQHPRRNPYALRRGGISLRLRTEAPQIVADECGTSLKIISDHYSFPIEDLRHQEPRPADVEWRAARTALAGSAGERERRGFFTRFSTRRKHKRRASASRATGVSALSSPSSPSPPGSRRS